MREWAEKHLMDMLQNEFDQWWAEQKHKPNPDLLESNWKYFPDQPITHWGNVERFLKDRYPTTSLGKLYGWEGACPVMECELRNRALGSKPSAHRGDVISSAMLRLHNLAQGRDVDRTSDP